MHAPRCFSSRPASVLVLSLLVLTSLGCGSGRRPVSPVTGQVIFQKKPAAGASVVFHPVATDADLQRLRPNGTTDREGRFRLTTYQPDDGPRKTCVSPFR